MTRRLERVSSVLHREIAALMTQLELGYLLTVTRVEVSQDLKQAKVWLSILPSSSKAEAVVLGELHNKIGEWQAVLKERLSIKIIPKLKFVVDHAEEYAARIDKLLRNLGKEEA